MRKRDDRSTTGDLMHQILQTEIASGEEIMIVVMTDKEVLVLTKGSWTKATDRKKGVRAINDAIKAGWPDPLEGLVESEFKVRPFEMPPTPSPQIAPLMDTVQGEPFALNPDESERVGKKLAETAAPGIRRNPVPPRTRS